MKAFAVILGALILSEVQAASWTQIKCSNSDGSVKWQEGHQEDAMELKYSNFVEGTLALDLDQVNVVFLKTTTIKEKLFKTCHRSVQGQVFVADVKITASEKNPYILRSHFPENKVKAEVICTKVTTVEHACN
jgi:hypothetical protein